MNGGAAVALLALVGHLASVDAGRIRGLAPSLATFVTGVLVAALASGATYISQWFYASNQSWDKTGLAFNILAILLGLGSYVVFAVGMWRGYSVLTAF
jgi:hypothetical protein